VFSLFINVFSFAQRSNFGELSKLVTPVKLNDYEQYSYLSKILENNKILALGEETHGTSEFFKIKTDIIKYCVIHLNYKILFIEADVSGTESINNYITKGVGSGKTVLFELGTAAWMTNEMLQLVEWLRIYNSQNTEDNKVLFCGIDVQWSSNIIKQLNKYYFKSNMLSVNSKNYLDSFSKFKYIHSYVRDTLLINELNSLDFSDVDSNENYKRLVNLLGQCLKLNQEIDDFKKSKLRDEFMAQNVIQSYKKFNKKAILWAHNEHITKTLNLAKYYPLGYYLSNEFDKSYYSIGLHTCQGKIGFYNKMIKEVNYLDIPLDNSNSSLSFILSRLEYNTFFFDINDLKNKTIKSQKLLYKKLRIRAATLIFDSKLNKYFITIHYKKSFIEKNYNAIIFINPSNGSTPFKIKSE
jgi:erythromycin esterase